MNNPFMKNIQNLKPFAMEDLQEECEQLREDLLKRELKIIEMRSLATGRVRDKLELAKFHVEIAIRQIMHILYPELDRVMNPVSSKEEE